MARPKGTPNTACPALIELRAERKAARMKARKAPAPHACEWSEPFQSEGQTFIRCRACGRRLRIVSLTDISDAARI